MCRSAGDFPFRRDRRLGIQQKEAITGMIEVKHLTKQYGDKLAVNDISFTVEDGEILGLLGPNGAGKSTTCLLYTSPSPRD